MDVIALACGIAPVEERYFQAAGKRLDQLAIPRGSLGRLLEAGRRYAAARRVEKPVVRLKKIATFAADHGVVAEGVSAFPREVTRQMVLNFMQGGAAINVLARHVGAEITVVDIGVDADFSDMPGLLKRKIARGTRNMISEPAMTRDEALAALAVGAELAQTWAREGCDLMGTGDMGIGNTTPSSAIIAALSGVNAAEVTSRGTGINDAALRRKIAAVDTAIALHAPDPRDPVDVLAKVGGFEIAGIAGLIIGAAAAGVPVVIDGFISGAGALIACEMHPAIRDYLFAAHLSVETGHRYMLERMGLRPMLDLDLRLGEGTGAALGMSLVEAGAKLVSEVLTFEEAGVTAGSTEPHERGEPRR
jgi:nicotinate-nucleotide--dimethylbenzimidazole phosphoribosyltransferase